MAMDWRSTSTRTRFPWPRASRCRCERTLLAGILCSQGLDVVDEEHVAIAIAALEGDGRGQAQGVKQFRNVSVVR